MGVHKRENQAEAFLNAQPVELQPLVTDCILATNSFVDAKELFLQKLRARSSDG